MKTLPVELTLDDAGYITGIRVTKEQYDLLAREKPIPGNRGFFKGPAIYPRRGIIEGLGRLMLIELVTAQKDEQKGSE